MRLFLPDFFWSEVSAKSGYDFKDPQDSHAKEELEKHEKLVSFFGFLSTSHIQRSFSFFKIEKFFHGQDEHDRVDEEQDHYGGVKEHSLWFHTFKKNMFESDVVNI